jgi:hypothetical protein
VVAVSVARSGRSEPIGRDGRIGTSCAGSAPTFSAPEREGNCVEYAHYFGWAFEQAAHAAGLRARAYVVRSDATVFGRHLPIRGLADHDWVLVVDPATRRRWHVDPSFGDASLGWDIAARVRGPVRLP